MKIFVQLAIVAAVAAFMAMVPAPAHAVTTPAVNPTAVQIKYHHHGWYHHHHWYHHRRQHNGIWIYF